jgi:hypothetical protein
MLPYTGDGYNITGEIWRVSEENLQGLDEYEGMNTATSYGGLIS